ncbi:MAG TPA: TlyA family RNA methyltransferase, partial [Firmicutes bacterium]|nr:TlyA family RNA methyltransferase [Bacillota bacterium]
VRVNGRVEDKPGTMVPVDCDMEVRPTSGRYVSRGGLKLEGALRDLDIDVNGKIAIDVGASTGGFTDCLLKHGARKVYAVDVGRGQLEWGLRKDPRVVVIEGVNIRLATPELFEEKADIITVDVSFISVTKFLGLLATLIHPGGEILLLVKPQFEAGRERVGKHGVVRDPAVHEQVIKEVIMAARDAGLTVRGLTFSPIKGPMGNIEFFLLLGPQGGQPVFRGQGELSTDAVDDAIRHVVEAAHRELSEK